MTDRARSRPTPRQLEVLATYASTGSYKLTGQRLGIAYATVRTTLETVRDRYEVGTTVQAYRAAVAAGHLRRIVGRSA